MSDYANFIEYTVEKKVRGIYLLQRIMMVFGYSLYAVLFLAFVFITKIMPLGAFIPISLWMIVHYTWRYVSISYEYELTMGEFVVSKIYGNRNRRKMAECRVSDLVWLEPAAGFTPRHKVTRRREAVSYPGSPLAYSAGLPNGDGKTYTEIVFEANEKLLKIMKFYNRMIFTIAK